MKKKLHIGLALVLAFIMMFSLLNGAMAEGGTTIFTVTLVPQEGATNILTELEDVEVGGTVDVDIFLTNTGNADVDVTGFAFWMDFSTGLALTDFVENGRGEYEMTDNKDGINFFSGGSAGVIHLKAAGDAGGGDTVLVGTMTLSVADSGLTYGDVLDVSLSSRTNIHIMGTSSGAQHPLIVKGQVEVVTQFDITWSGMVENDETVKVGVGIVPTHDTPVKDGYTFTGWNPAVVAATADATYTAQWSPTSYTVAFADGTAFGEGVTAPTTYDIENPITVTPVKDGCIFAGWTAAPATEGDTDYNWPDGTVTDTTGKYGNVVLTPVWIVDADVVFADYAYAGNGNRLLLVGINSIANGNALSYNGESMFTTTDARYLELMNAADGAISGVIGNGKEATNYATAYLYIVPNTTSAAQAVAALSIDSGTNTAVRRDGDVNSDGIIDSEDFGIVNDLLSRFTTDASVQIKLEADVIMGDGETYPNYKFGTIDDIITIIKMQ